MTFQEQFKTKLELFCHGFDIAPGSYVEDGCDEDGPLYFVTLINGLGCRDYEINYLYRKGLQLFKKKLWEQGFVDKAGAVHPPHQLLEYPSFIESHFTSKVEWEKEVQEKWKGFIIRDK